MDTKQGCTLRSSEMWHKWPSRRKTRGKREILSTHVRLPGICETTGLGLILHSKLETGKCGHDSTFKSAPPLSQQTVWALFEKKRGKNYKSMFPQGMAVSSTGFEKKQPDPSGERTEEHRELHLSGLGLFLCCRYRRTPSKAGLEEFIKISMGTCWYPLAVTNPIVTW